MELWDRETLIFLIEEVQKTKNIKSKKKDDFIESIIDRIKNLKNFLKTNKVLRSISIGLILFLMISTLIPSKKINEEPKNIKNDKSIVELSANENVENKIKEDINSESMQNEEEKDNKDEIENNTLNEKEYWAFVDKTLKEIINDHGLAIYNIEHNYSYMVYYIAPAEYYDAEDKYIVTKLSYEDYKESIDDLKKSLKIHLDKVKIEEPKSIFSEPTCDILSLDFSASHIKGTSIRGLVPVGCYQIRIIDYYYGDEFIQIDYLKDFEYK